MFEHGPLRCIYVALRGKAQNVGAAPPAREALCACLTAILDALHTDGWLRTEGGP